MEQTSLSLVEDLNPFETPISTMLEVSMINLSTFGLFTVATKQCCHETPTKPSKKSYFAERNEVATSTHRALVLQNERLVFKIRRKEKKGKSLTDKIWKRQTNKNELLERIGNYLDSAGPLHLI